MMLSRRLGLGSAVAIALALFAATSSAHPGYPDVVQASLDLATTPACCLCHVSCAGGGPLGNFGELLVNQYGLNPSTAAEDDASLQAALSALQAGPDVQLVEDLKSGRDPNLDTTAANVPKYGCVVGGVGTGTPEAWAASFWLALAAAWFVRARRSRRAV